MLETDNFLHTQNVESKFFSSHVEANQLEEFAVGLARLLEGGHALKVAAFVGLWFHGFVVRSGSDE